MKINSKLRAIGTSCGFIIPKLILKSFKIEEGDDLILEIKEIDGKEILLISKKENKII